jgi:hypothetical protein
MMAHSRMYPGDRLRFRSPAAHKACAENDAVHAAVTDAGESGATGGVGATCTLACSHTRPSASPIARTVSPVGRHDRSRDALLAIVASGRLRRSNSAATATDASAAARSRRVARLAPGTGDRMRSR